MTHVNAVDFCELPERLATAFLFEDALTRVTDVATTPRGGEISFLLTTSNRLENLRHLDRRRLARLENLVNFLIVAIRDA